MPIGGLRGCIQSLQKVVRESKPDMIVICWDGQGGSKKRKLLKKDYKAGRKPIRLNRSIRNLSEEQEVDNKIWQQTRLIFILQISRWPGQWPAINPTILMESQDSD